jgi:hypothetical protein
VEPKTEASGERVEVMEKKVGASVGSKRSNSKGAHAARMVSISVEPATSERLSVCPRPASELSHDFSPTAPVCARRIEHRRSRGHTSPCLRVVSG